MTLCMYVARCSTIDKLQTWIGRSDWPTLISKVERDYFRIFTLQRIRDEAFIKTNTTIASILKTKKREWLESGGHQ